MRKLGWVHRNVSVGNILLCKEGAKLADLEYAKKAGDVKSHEMRTASRSPLTLSGE
jgi:serine/threonine protein kinase